MSEIQKISTFSERLRFLREKRGFSREDLAKKLGLSSSSQISRYETGVGLPSIAIIQKYTEVLQANLHWLLTGNPSPDGESWKQAYNDLAGITWSYIHRENMKLQQEKSLRLMEYNDLKLKESNGEPVPAERLAWLEEEMVRLKIRFTENEEISHQILKRLYGNGAPRVKCEF